MKFLIPGVTIVCLFIFHAARLDRKIAFDEERYEHGRVMRRISIDARPTYDRLRSLRAQCRRLVVVCK